jgi:hypothetical protein
LLKYATAETRLPPTELHLAHIDADIIGRFLTFCEDERGNSARSRNTRLGSGLVDHSQKSTVAARARAEKKTVGPQSRDRETITIKAAENSFAPARR